MFTHKRNTQTILNLLLLPSRNFTLTIPIILCIGFVTGLFIDTSPLKNYLLFATVLMIYPTNRSFYAVNYFIAIKLGRRYFNRQDTLTLIFGTVLRNLAISIGLAATAFGARAALMVSLAFLFQGQSAAWFIRLDERYKILPESSTKAGDI